MYTYILYKNYIPDYIYKDILCIYLYVLEFQLNNDKTLWSQRLTKTKLYKVESKSAKTGVKTYIQYF
jgi:hypothetical protein